MNKSPPPVPMIILIIVLIILIISLFTINYFIPIIPKDYHNTSPQQLEAEREKENFRGGRYRRRRNRLRPSRRRWWGDNWGYRYRPPPPPPIYNYSWYNPWFWFSPICKRGCTQTSIGEWGCQYPGYSPNDCMFASDCRGC